MSREPRDGGADVEAVYAQGQSGNFPSPYLTLRDLRDLLDRCHGGEKLIRNIEAFELDGEWDKPRIDLSLYAGGASEQLRLWDDRVAEMTEAVEDLLTRAADEQGRIMFIVWLDTKQPR